MTDFQRAVILLIKSALDESKEEIPENLDWNEIIDLGRKHQIISLLYYGVVYSQPKIEDEYKTLLENTTFQYILHDQNQQYQINAISKKFEENGIDFMPIKGTILKHDYPKTEMRPMSDADILIKTEQYEKIKPIMAELGFEEKYESDHELVWKKKSSLMVELHKRIIPSYNKDYYAYFGDGWRLANLCENSKFRYEMSPEDELIYNFTHMAKHYRDGGIGIRHIIDIFICQLKSKSIDKAYIEKELTKLQLWEFYQNVNKTINVWFKKEKATEKTDFITSYIFSSGSYGTQEVKIVASAVKTSKSTKNVKLKRFSDLVFLPYEKMCKKYSVLIKIPVLLPFLWVVRIFTALFTKQDVIKKQNANLKITNVENINDFQESLNYVGLDFNFKE